MYEGIGTGIGEGMKGFADTYMATEKHYADLADKKASAGLALEKNKRDIEDHKWNTKINNLKMKKLEQETDPDIYKANVQQAQLVAKTAANTLEISAFNLRKNNRTIEEQMVEAEKQIQGLQYLDQNFPQFAPRMSMNNDGNVSVAKVSKPDKATTQKVSDYTSYMNTIKDKMGDIIPGREEDFKQAEAKVKELLFKSVETPKKVNPINAKIKELRGGGTSDEDIKKMLIEAKIDLSEYGF